ncbi:hypothetical protein BAUCODRAFT_64611, partial [Baudoinia panamericana UAMH 10762]
MPNGFLKNTAIAVVWPIDEFTEAGWTKQKVESWITKAGGRMLSKFTNKTTHVVCDEKRWKMRGEVVREAIKAREANQRLRIVSSEWLEKTLRDSKREKEQFYSWEKKDRDAREVQKKVDQEMKKKEGGGGSVSNPQAHILADVFMEHTEQYLDPKEKSKIEAMATKDREAIRKKLEEEVRTKQEKEHDEKRRKTEEEKALMKRGSKKAKNVLFSDNHHILKDCTGFSYEVVLTKVDFKLNRNERCTLTIYESNTQPETYATNLHHAGTFRVPSINIIAAIGCNYHTALHAFKKIFHEKTGVEWDHRIEFADFKLKQDKRNRGQSTGSPALTEPTNDPDFNKRTFFYQPPAYGTKG